MFSFLCSKNTSDLPRITRPITPICLNIHDLCCCFGTVPVVQNVHLQVLPGEHVAVIGGNGSGKTTLLRAIMGLHKGWTGQIHLDGKELPSKPSAAHPRLAWMPQRQPKGQFPFTVRELLIASGHEQEALNAARRLGINDLLNRPLTALSGGQLQRSYLARALGVLSSGAGLLLADEPTAALDFSGQEHMAEMIVALPATMLVVTHDLALAKKCHRVLQMAQGRIREMNL
jgi:zinc transport system ATP-binding protein